ncbi:phosphotransferase [Kineococcus sp. SYSU DK006]|uniref:phosphotransferase n=1 Tax=Kineococcus sp. SYSU DK006 TaxID=3383127 RepID=UPI003D7D1A8F
MHEEQGQVPGQVPGEAPDEEVLTGGGVNRVVRRGDRVLRPVGAWTPRVHELLRRLEREGFRAAPRVHGTAGGLEELDFLPGRVSNYPVTDAAASEAALRSAAALLREYHDVTARFARELPREGWVLPVEEPVEVVCHGDFAPHNCVLDGERVVGLIDFDTARPGARLLDVAAGAYRWVPLSSPEADGVRGDVAEHARRLAVFCDVYGLGERERAGLLDAVIASLEGLVRFMHEQAAAGSAAFAGHVAAGHDRLYRSDAEHVARHRELFEAALGTGGR